MLMSDDNVRKAVYSLHRHLMKMLQYLTPLPGRQTVELLNKAAEESRLYEEQLNVVRRYSGGCRCRSLLFA